MHYVTTGTIRLCQSVLARLVFLSILTYVLGSLGAAAQPFTAVVESRTASEVEDVQPELILQIGHRLLVTSVVYAPDGKTLASGGWDGTVKLWDADTGQIKRTLLGHNFFVSSTAFSPDGKTLASAAGMPEMRESPETPGEVILWDSQSGQRIKTLPQFDHPVSALAFTADGRSLITVSHRVETPSQAASQPGFSRRRSGPVTGIVQFWDLATFKARHTITLFGNMVSAISLSPDGNLLAVGATVFKGVEVTGRDPKTQGVTSQRGRTDAEVLLYDVSTGFLKRKLVASGSELRALVFSPDSKLLATGHGLDHDDNYGPVRLWDVASGKFQQTLQTGQEADWGDVDALAFSPDGASLAAAKSGLQSYVHLWDLATGKVKRKLGRIGGGLEQFTALKFAPDGNGLAVSGGHLDHGLVQVWQSNSLHVRWSNSTPSFHIGQIALTNDGNTLASTFDQTLLTGQSVGSVQLWDARVGSLTRSLPAPDLTIFSLAFSPNNRLIGAGGFTMSDIHGSVRLWDVATGRPGRTMTPERGASSLKFTPDSNRVFIGDGYQVSLWDTRLGKSLRLYEPQFSVGDELDIAPDGQVVASVGGRADTGGFGELRLWSLGSGKPLWTQQSEQHYIGTVAFSPGNRVVATGHSDSTIQLWDKQNGQPIRTLSGHKERITRIAFSADGGSLVSASIDGTIKIWDATTETVKITLEQNRPVVDFALTKDGNAVWSLTSDNLLRLWDTRSAKLLATMEVLSSQSNPKGYLTTEWIAYTPEGAYHCSSGATKYIHWRIGNNIAPASEYEKRFHRPVSVRRALQGNNGD